MLVWFGIGARGLVIEKNHFYEQILNFFCRWATPNPNAEKVQFYFVKVASANYLTSSSYLRTHQKPFGVFFWFS